MIDKREILEFASTLKLAPNVVEKDYVLGWILAGISNNSELDSWAFKGGTCLKKCFFETYRFSEDLDFTLSAAGHIDEDFLKKVLSDTCTWITEESGITLPREQISVDIYTNPRGKLSCQGKLGYRGPLSLPTNAGWPKIKLDLTSDERVVLPPSRRPVFHPYSDSPEGGISVNCYAYTEAFAEKFRALGERTRPRDLYDVVNLFRHLDGRPSPFVLRDVLKQKCEYKSIPVPTMEALAPFKEDLEAKWQAMLAHQLPVLPQVADFWAALPEIFDWITTGAAAPQREIIRAGASEISTIRSRVLPMSIPSRARQALEIIRFAATNQLCVDLSYDGKVRRIEPYSLRETADHNYVLHAIRSDSGDHRSYRLDRIQSASVSSQSFSPRYVIELTESGPVPVVQSTAQPRSERTAPKGSTRSKNNGPTYVYRCPSCGKTFERKSMNASLNPHKNSQGFQCYGSNGTFVRTKY
ncbi:MAG: nucleotidyl transferase AbiEii/AbiGii toxin family protein [Candidatus Obscuribacter phosphatis]|uniref:Nucleotidyl transferase AbiEii/AbiGii toxin family protein n=1 Tax=Candidatus Obscuribacter phosphatis TaxID=1906157 RepID=A0A8J7PFG0_9BACT|nr:nucleotidyl transferase AbiEii/AbiGii toxin family protein [Candidatus Obscuribacter phosphatis]